MLFAYTEKTSVVLFAYFSGLFQHQAACVLLKEIDHRSVNYFSFYGMHLLFTDCC